MYYYIDQIQIAHPDAYESEEKYKERWKWVLKLWNCCPDAHFLYDRLKEEGKDLGVSADVKNTLWALSGQNLAKDVRSKGWVKRYSNLPEGSAKTELKTFLDDYRQQKYKSFIVRYILAKKAYFEGNKIELQDEDGNKVQQLTFVAK